MKFDAPIDEVSGLCFAGSRLVLVGDAQEQLAWTQWREGPTEWHVVDVAGEGLEQFEAVEWLGDDLVCILCEEPAILAVASLVTGEVHWQHHLRVPGELGKAWRKDPNSRGEGLVIGPDRVFVIKEKKPSAILEFGTEPAVGLSTGSWRPGPLTLLTTTLIRGLDDVSDATVVDGQVWVVSDQSRTIARLHPDGSVSDSIRIDVDKPEGLVRTPEGRWLVGADRSSGRESLHLL